MSNIFRIFVGNMWLFLWPQWRLQCDLKVTESKRQTRDDFSDSQASWAPLDLGSPPSCRWFYDFMNQVVDKSYWMVVTSRTTTLYGYDTILVLWVRTMQPFSFFWISCLSCFFWLCYVYVVGIFVSPQSHWLSLWWNRNPWGQRYSPCNVQRWGLGFMQSHHPWEPALWLWYRAKWRRCTSSLTCGAVWGWLVSRKVGGGFGVVMFPVFVRIWCFLFTCNPVVLRILGHVFFSGRKTDPGSYLIILASW